MSGAAPGRPDPFSGALEPGAAPALLLIDLVGAYFDEDGPFAVGSAEPLLAAGRLLASARDAGIPVVHTRVGYAEGGIDGGHFIRKVPALEVFIGDGPLGRIRAEVAPAAGEPVLIKQYASAFFGTSLAATLRASGVDTVILAGVSTSGCVRASAVDALQHGFVPIVVRDAVGDRDPSAHEANLHDIQTKYGEVRGIESVLETIRRSRKEDRA